MTFKTAPCIINAFLKKINIKSNYKDILLIFHRIMLCYDCCKYRKRRWNNVSVTAPVLKLYEWPSYTHIFIYCSCNLMFCDTNRYIKILTKLFCFRIVKSSMKHVQKVTKSIFEYANIFTIELLPLKDKGLGSLTNNFCPANFEKIILQRASKCFNYYKI